MSLTKEMIMGVEKQIQLMGTTELVMFYFNCRNQNIKYPNSYDKYREETSYKEIINRGIEEELNVLLSKNW